MLKILVEVTGDTRVTAAGVFSVKALLDFEITQKKKTSDGAWSEEPQMNFSFLFTLVS